ncbi:MAG: FtsX-like permease family protein [Synergistaceae bacterium]|nr:FtsX-like permease family protein [Synergistaceae bacterium]
MIAFGEILHVSLRSLRANKMRSALTALGIVIGVAAVVAMFAIGTGASRNVEAQLASMGTNLLVVRSGSTTSGGLRMGYGAAPTLTFADAEAIVKECPAVGKAAPTASGSVQVVYGNSNWSTRAEGTTPPMLDIRNWTIGSGRSFNNSEVRSAAKVCLLGQTVADNLFGNEDPIGKVVRVKKIPMVVVGVLGKKGTNAMGQDQDDTLIIPITTAQKRVFGSRFQGRVSSILVQAADANSIQAAIDQIDALLSERHRVRSEEEKDFTVMNLAELMEAAAQSTKTLSFLLAAVASISLLVGGIGIMNIMLVSVTERTREIGIRMAVGARTPDILLQFLSEAVILSVLGGVTGILLGAAVSFLIGHFAGWPTVISPLSIALAFGFSALVGIFFGYYPASKAAALDPIEALRYE